MKSLFVIGAPRSGTTLTRTLLKGFAPVYLPPDEFQILARFIALAESGADAAELAQMLEDTVFSGHMRRRGIWPGREQIAQAMAGQRPKDAFRAMVLAIAEKDGAEALQYWGDKTPETVFQLDLVMRLWPDARIIEVVRDPRSTVLSMHKAWGRSLLRGAVIWRDAQIATASFAQSHGPDQLYKLNFEALTADPSVEMDRLGGWLGLRYDHSVLDDVSSEERWGQASGSKGVQQRKAEWQEAFAPQELRLIEEICFDTMQAAGYSPVEAQQPRHPDPLALRLAKAGDAWRVLRSYARERGWAAALRYKLSQWRNR